jgi:hypothetical protein
VNHLVLEIALWTLVAFFVGCVLGFLLRRMFASGEREAQAQMVPSPAVPPEEA